MYSLPGRKLKAFFKGNSSGQVLPLVLGLLVLGSLSIAPFLHQAATSVKGMSVMRNLGAESYSSNSGIEHSRWRLQFESGFADSINQTSTTYNYDYSINNRAADIKIDWVPPSPSPSPTPTPVRPQSDRVVVEYNIVPSYLLPDQVTTVTITVTGTNVDTSNVKYKQVGDLLPPSFTYIPGSSIHVNPSGTTPLEPAITIVSGRQQLTWDWGPPRPNLKPGESAQQIFQAAALPPEGVYYNEAWYWFEEDSIGIIYARNAIPIVAEYRKYDVMSKVGHVTLKSRLGKNDFYVKVLSWHW